MRNKRVFCLYLWCLLPSPFAVVFPRCGNHVSAILWVRLCLGKKEKELRGHIFGKKIGVHSPFFATTGQRGRRVQALSALNQTHPGLSAFGPPPTRRLWFSFNIFWIRRNALTLLYFLLRNGSLAHLGTALTEILCLRKNWGGKKPTTFPIIGKMGGKSYSRSFSRGKKSLLRGSCQLVLLCCILWFREKQYCLFHAGHKWLSTTVGVFNTTAPQTPH